MKYQLTPNSSFLTFLQRAEEYGITIETKWGNDNSQKIFFKYTNPFLSDNYLVTITSSCSVDEAVDCLNSIISVLEERHPDFYRKKVASVKKARKISSQKQSEGEQQ